MYKYEPSAMDIIKDKNGVPLSAQYFYGSAYADHFLFHDPESLPRFGHLARKALMHYLGDQYNPHNNAIIQEPFIRLFVKSFIEYRIEHKTIGYDWDYIDNFLKQTIGSLYGAPLEYDKERVKKGVLPPYRGANHPMEPTQA
jgi:hypothetical protein